MKQALLRSLIPSCTARDSFPDLAFLNIQAFFLTCIIHIINKRQVVKQRTKQHLNGIMTCVKSYTCVSMDLTCFTLSVTPINDTHNFVSCILVKHSIALFPFGLGERIESKADLQILTFISLILFYFLDKNSWAA